MGQTETSKPLCARAEGSGSEARAKSAILTTAVAIENHDSLLLALEISRDFGCFLAIASYVRSASLGVVHP